MEKQTEKKQKKYKRDTRLILKWSQ